jgi:hypothetical protein
MERDADSRFADRRRRARRWLIERAGGWEYRLRPRQRAAWGGPFNGQSFRQRLFAELAGAIAFESVIETGTYRGTTTAHFRQITDAAIHSFEANPRHYGFATQQLKSVRNLHLHCCDSRDGLTALATARMMRGNAFFYLDAHGFGDLPLASEIALAFGHWPGAVVMVDDFAVPDDPGYGFDDYGAGQALTLEYLADNQILPSGVWFPRCASAAETGERRGCVVLADDADLIRRLDALETLRRWTLETGGRASARR